MPVNLKLNSRKSPQKNFKMFAVENIKLLPWNMFYNFGFWKQQTLIYFRYYRLQRKVNRKQRQIYVYKTDKEKKYNSTIVDKFFFL